MTISKRSVLPTAHEAQILEPKHPLAKIRTGRDLGLRAAHFRAKSATAFIEFARCVFAAHDRWYEPWLKVGRPGSKPKERLDAEGHWRDFLDECGLNPRKQAKLIRRFAQIGRHSDVLEANSANLPSSLETLAVITGADVSEADVPLIAAKLSPQSTTKDAKNAIESLRSAAVATDAADGDTAATSQLSSPNASAPLDANNENDEPVVLKIDVSEDHIVPLAATIAVGELLNFGVHNLATSDRFEGRLANTVAQLRQSDEIRALGALLWRLEADLRGAALKVALEDAKRTLTGRRKRQSSTVQPSEQEIRSAA